MSLTPAQLKKVIKDKKVVLNVGCGNEYLTTPTEGKVVINIDLNEEVKCDLVMDLEKDKFPFEDGRIFGIVAKHVVEHVWNRDKFMNEMWRVLEPGGKIYIETPKAGTNAYWKDPTHISGWVPDTFRYYCDWNTCPANMRKTWQMGQCVEEQRGSDLIIICELIKPE